MAKEPKKKAVKKVSNPSTVKKAVTKKAATKKTVTKKAAVKTPVVKKVAAQKTTKKAVKKAVKKVVKTKPTPVITTVIARVDAGFGNEVYIRGNSSGLTWGDGALMENTGTDEWIWQSSSVTSELEFKVLLNDEVWSTGPNGVVFPGATVVFEPGF